MFVYYPVAIAMDRERNMHYLSSYTGFSSISECKKQFELWQKEYKHKFNTATVQVFLNGENYDTRYFEYYKDEWLEID